MNAKMLHKYSLSVVSFAMAVLAISAVWSATLAVSGQASRPALLNSLTRNAFTIEGSRNGTARIHTSNTQINNGELASIDDMTDASIIFFALHQAE